MDSEIAPPRGLIIAIWTGLVLSILLACAPVLLGLLLIFGAH